MHSESSPYVPFHPMPAQTTSESVIRTRFEQSALLAQPRSRAREQLHLATSLSFGEGDGPHRPRRVWTRTVGGWLYSAEPPPRGDGT